jgi:hypothetical protein
MCHDNFLVVTFRHVSGYGPTAGAALVGNPDVDKVRVVMTCFMTVCHFVTFGMCQRTIPRQAQHWSATQALGG